MTYDDEYGVLDEVAIFRALVDHAVEFHDVRVLQRLIGGCTGLTS